MIRLSFATFAVLVLAAGSPGGEAKADPYRWCAQYTLRGGASNCYFMTLEQCRWAVSGVGGNCSPNPFYTGAPIGGDRPARRAKKKKSRTS